MPRFRAIIITDKQPLPEHTYVHSHPSCLGVAASYPHVCIDQTSAVCTYILVAVALYMITRTHAALARDVSAWTSGRSRRCESVATGTLDGN